MASANPSRRHRDVRIFISAATADLGSVRSLVKAALEKAQYIPVEMTSFELSALDLPDKLREKIGRCHAMVHIAGRCFGGEPAARPEGQPRRSFTQMEYHIARELGVDVYHFVTGEGFPLDAHEPEDSERAGLQEQHRRMLLGMNQEYAEVTEVRKLIDLVQTLQVKTRLLETELTQVDDKVDRVQATLDQYTQNAANAEKLAQRITERFIDRLQRERGMTPEQAYQQALAELPAELDMSPEQVGALIGRVIVPRSSDATLTPVQRAEAAFASGDYEAVFAQAAQQHEESRRMALLEGSAYLARFRQTPDPRWNEEALAAYRRAMALSAEGSAEWATAASWAASVLHDLSRYAEAEPLMRRALTIAEASYGKEHPNVAIRLNNLAALLQATNRLSEAEPLMRRALTIDEASYGKEHPKVAIRLNNLAQLLQATNRLSEAESLMRRVVEIFEISYGKEHPNVATALNNLAQLLKATNRLSEAEPLMRRALTIDEASYGKEHPEVARDLNNLAQLLQATNRLSEAEPLMRRALTIDEASYGKEHPNVAIRLNNLAALLQATNRLGEAEPLMRRALTIDETSYGKEHPNVARDLNNLAQLLQDTNRLSEAEPLMRRVVEIFEISYGKEHPNVATALNNLAQLLQDTNRLSEAEPLMRRVVEIFEISYGKEHPNVATALNNLAQLLQDTNRLSEAESLMRRALTIDEASYGKEHPEVATDLNNLAQLLKATNRLSEAEPLMRRVVEIFLKFTEATSHEHPHMRAAIGNYGGLLEAMGKTDAEIRAELNVVLDRFGMSLGDE